MAYYEAIRAGETIGRTWGTLFLGVVLFGLVGFLFWIWREPIYMLLRSLRGLLFGSWISNREAERFARDLVKRLDEAEERMDKRRRERFTGKLE